jgi:integrase/recombinase XerC
MNSEIVPLHVDVPALRSCTVPALPSVTAMDLHAALLADARKATTRRAREQDAADLARFLGRVDPSAACALLVAGDSGQANAIATAYVRSMLDRRLSPATVNRRVSTVRRLVKLARRFGLIGWTVEVDALRVESYRDTSGPGRSGWLRMLDAAERAAKKTSIGKRDLAMIRLLHDQGLRRAEVEALELSDLDADAGRLFVIGKGKGEKSPIRLNKPTLLALFVWLDSRGSEPGPLFIRLDRARPKERTERLDGDGIHLAVARLGRRAGLNRNVWPHALRHEAVTRVLELNGGNIDAAQKFARHADPKTTQKYNDNRRDLAGDMARLLGDDS